MIEDYPNVTDNDESKITVENRPSSSFYDKLMLPKKINNLVKGSIMTSEFPVNSCS